MTVARKLASISAALDEISFEWMGDNHPQLAEAIEMEVRRGASPVSVRRLVMAETSRHELALRCEQAARFVARASEGS